MVSLDQTSLPSWAYAPQVEPADAAGRSHTILVVEPSSVTPPRTHPSAVAEGWQVDLRARRVRVHACADAAAAVTALHADLADARVGHRVLVAGTADDCLAVRAAAVRAGLADDELVFGVVAADERTVWCVHCGTTTRACVAIDEVVACVGCRRELVVYPHVSRRTGHHLGFMVDAEDQTWESSA